MSNQLISESARAVGRAYLGTSEEIPPHTARLTRIIAWTLSAQDPCELRHLVVELSRLIRSAAASLHSNQAERWRGLLEVAQILYADAQEVGHRLDSDLEWCAMAPAALDSSVQLDAAAVAEQGQPENDAPVPNWSGSSYGAPSGALRSRPSSSAIWPARASVPGELVAAIGKQPGISSGGVAHYTGKSKSHVSNEVSKLERVGFIRRVRQGKTRRLYLTSLGQRFLASMTEGAGREPAPSRERRVAATAP